MTTNPPLAPFSSEDLDALIAFAKDQGLPPAIRSEIHGTIGLLLVADSAAVTAWADRLETEVTTYFGVPATMYRQDGYEVWIAVERGR